MLWLQRDFHLYIVNAFDTEKACQVRPTSSGSAPDAYMGGGIGVLYFDTGAGPSLFDSRTLLCDYLNAACTQLCALAFDPKFQWVQASHAALKSCVVELLADWRISYRASLRQQVLERDERSLGSLLEDFCGVRKQKQHQRADWRQRCCAPNTFHPASQ